MRYRSTRRNSPDRPLSAAIRAGAAPDGGLFLPERIPVMAALPDEPDLPAFAATFLAGFFADDPLADHLPTICREAFDFPIPLVTPDPARPGLRALELFHGPTLAFKDFGARFLMACFDRIGEEEHPLTVLAATSGDTGGAVGCAAEGRRKVRAVILYPRGRVSPFQERQLTCWQDPVRALEVEGDFDACQALAKAAFADVEMVRQFNLTSANSINIGRLLPQMAYIAFAAARLFAETGTAPGLVVPTGNLGHGFAAVYARAMGAPIGPILLATNANPALSRWKAEGVYRPAPSLVTLANAMDVGAPSNFERLVDLPEALREIEVERVDDAAIVARIRADHSSASYAWCPHSATAAEAYARLDPVRRGERPWIVAATAHPFKFAETVEPQVGRRIAAPPALAAIAGRPTRRTPISDDLAALQHVLAQKNRAN